MRQVAGSDPVARERAFRELVRRHGGAVSRFASSYGLDRAASEDVVQESFLRVYQARDRYRAKGGASFRTWLLTIARNQALDRRRRASRRPAQPLLDPEQAGADSDLGPVAALLGALDAEAVRAAVAALPDPDREVIALRFYEQLTYAEIGEVVSATSAAVKQRVWRTLQRLRTSLGEEA